MSDITIRPENVGMPSITIEPEKLIGPEMTFKLNITGGTDGFSPTVDVSEIEGGHRVTITDKNGEQSFDVLNGTGEGTDGNVQIMKKDIAGIAKVGDNLIIDGEGRLSVDTANEASQDNTKPITSAAVHTVVGNIEVLLSTI